MGEKKVVSSQFLGGKKEARQVFSEEKLGKKWGGKAGLFLDFSMNAKPLKRAKVQHRCGVGGCEGLLKILNGGSHYYVYTCLQHPDHPDHRVRISRLPDAHNMYVRKPTRSLHPSAPSSTSARRGKVGVKKAPIASCGTCVVQGVVEPVKDYSDEELLDMIADA